MGRRHVRLTTYYEIELWKRIMERVHDTRELKRFLKIFLNNWKLGFFEIISEC
jgi:hypothetical protein